MNRMKIEELFSFLLCDFVYIFFTSFVTGRARSHTQTLSVNCRLSVCFVRMENRNCGHNSHNIAARPVQRVFGSYKTNVIRRELVRCAYAFDPLPIPECCLSIHRVYIRLLCFCCCIVCIYVVWMHVRCMANVDGEKPVNQLLSESHFHFILYILYIYFFVAAR